MDRVYGELAVHYGTREQNARFYQYIGRALIGRMTSLGLEGGQPGGRVLEVGCGTGLFTGLLREALPDHHIDACDASPAMLSQFSHCLREDPRIALHQGPLRELAPGLAADPGGYDLSMGNMCFHWLKKPDLEALTGLLVPGGAAFFSVPLSRPFSEKAGNRLLMRVLMSLRDELDRERSPGFLEEALYLAFYPLKIVDTHTMELVERFHSRREMVDCLWSRGSLHAIYGHLAPRARELLMEGPPYDKRRWKLDWGINLVQATVLGNT